MISFWACYFFKQYLCESEVAQSCPTLCDPMDCSLRLLHPWDFPGKSARVDCHFLLQGMFPTQESNLGLPNCRQTLYRLSHQGSSKVELKALSTDERINKMWSIYVTQCCLVMKKKEWNTNHDAILCLVKEASHKRPHDTIYMNIQKRQIYSNSKQISGMGMKFLVEVTKAL